MFFNLCAVNCCLMLIIPVAFNNYRLQDGLQLAKPAYAFLQVFFAYGDFYISSANSFNSHFPSRPHIILTVRLFCYVFVASAYAAERYFIIPLFCGVLVQPEHPAVFDVKIVDGMFYFLIRIFVSVLPAAPVRLSVFVACYGFRSVICRLRS